MDKQGCLNIKQVNHPTLSYYVKVSNKGDFEREAVIQVSCHKLGNIKRTLSPFPYV